MVTRSIRFENERRLIVSKLKMTPSEALVETMAAEGVKNVFGIVGSA